MTTTHSSRPSRSTEWRTSAMALAIALACCGTAVAAPAEQGDLRFGRARVLSAQGSPLNVTVPIDGLNRDSAATLSVRLADAAAWAQAGLTPPAALNSMRVDVSKVSPSRQLIRVVSSQASDADTIDLLFEVVTSAGARQVQFSVLAPQSGLARPPAPALASPSARPATELASATRSSATRSSATRSSATRSTATSADRSAGQTTSRPTETSTGSTETPATVEANEVNARPPASVRGTVRVRQGQTLSGIAMAHPVSKADYYQMIVALWQANPDAFIDGNMNLVHEGRRLSLPDADTVRAVDTDFARRTYSEHLDAHSRYRARVGGAAATSAAVAGGSAGGTVSEAAPSQPAPVSADQDRLRLTSGETDPTAQAADRSAADALALADAGDRVGQLIRNIEDLNRANQTGGVDGATPAADATGAGGPGTPGVSTSGKAAGPEYGADGAAGVRAAGMTGGTGGSAATAGATGAVAAVGPSAANGSSTTTNNGGAGDLSGRAADATDEGPLSMSGLPAWLTDNLLIVLTGILAIIAFAIAWVVRRAAARREDDGNDNDPDDDLPSARTIDPVLIDRQLDRIDLDLDRPPADGTAAEHAATEGTGSNSTTPSRDRRA